jgi:hypothetical protein
MTAGSGRRGGTRRGSVELIANLRFEISENGDNKSRSLTAIRKKRDWVRDDSGVRWHGALGVPAWFGWLVGGYIVWGGELGIVPASAQGFD